MVAGCTLFYFASPFYPVLLVLLEIAHGFRQIPLLYAIVALRQAYGPYDVIQSSCQRSSFVAKGFAPNC